MKRDWIEWHRSYEDSGSSLSQRLRVIRRELRSALSPLRSDGRASSVISMCAGDGRDVLPVLACLDRPDQVRALLVELDPKLAGRARAGAQWLGLPPPAVQIVIADAGITDRYLDASPVVVPAHVLLACGVFGNVPVADAVRTITALPGLLAAGGVVIWTRGHGGGEIDASVQLRARFATEGFEEVSFTAAGDAGFRVGAHRWVGGGGRRAAVKGFRMFAFGD